MHIELRDIMKLKFLNDLNTIVLYRNVKCQTISLRFEDLSLRIVNTTYANYIAYFCRKVRIVNSDFS